MHRKRAEEEKPWASAKAETYHGLRLWEKRPHKIVHMCYGRISHQPFKIQLPQSGERRVGYGQGSQRQKNPGIGQSCLWKKKEGITQETKGAQFQKHTGQKNTSDGGSFDMGFG